MAPRTFSTCARQRLYTFARRLATPFTDSRQRRFLTDMVPGLVHLLDRRIEGEIELVQFGLMPDFIGQGLGRYFLQWTIDKAWSYSPRRFWLHTCTKDHPAALPNYLKAGFEIYKEGTNEKDDM